MSLKLTFQTTKQGKQATIVAGNATYKYHGVAEVPTNVAEQLRFFGLWDELVAKLPLTAGFAKLEQLQDAVRAAASGNTEPARALVGAPPRPGQSLEVEGFEVHIVGDVEIGGLPPGSVVRRVAPAEAYSQENLLADFGETITSDCDMTKNARNHGQIWSDEDQNRLIGWFNQSRRERKTLDVVVAGRLLGRTPYAVLCKLINLKALSEASVYAIISVMHTSLAAVRRDAAARRREACQAHQAELASYAAQFDAHRVPRR